MKQTKHLEPTHKPSPKTYAEIPSSLERAEELRAQALELRKFAGEGKIEHFASEFYRRELRLIRTSLDVGSELRIIQEAERMEDEAQFMEMLIKENASPCSLHSTESE
jgi:hypothetical protein